MAVRRVIVTQRVWRVRVETPDHSVRTVRAGGQAVRVVMIGVQGPPGPTVESRTVYGETPAGVVGGSNATFTAEFAFEPETVAVSVNGLRQKLVRDFNTSGARTILFTASPEAGDLLQINYRRN